MIEFQDITAPEHVQVEVRSDGKVIWIHVDGITVTRICRIGNLQISDHRTCEQCRGSE